MTSFEDQGRTLEEINALFFYTLYFWTVAFVFPLVINYHDFLALFFFLLVKCSLLYTSCVLKALYAFNDISITYKKNLKKKRVGDLLNIPGLPYFSFPEKK
jgi:hypothetical protein